jgi:hypothetical protein
MLKISEEFEEENTARLTDMRTGICRKNYLYVSMCMDFPTGTYIAWWPYTIYYI